MNRRLLLLIVAMACALLGAFVTFSNEYANHAPTPHDVPIQAVASPQVVAQLQAGLAMASPGVPSSSSRPTAPSSSSARVPPRS